MGDTQQLTRVTEEIRQLAVDLPFEMAEQLSIAFSETNTGDWQRLRVHVIGTVSPSAVRQRVSAFIEMWSARRPT